MDAEADTEALACLPPLAPQISAVLQRPDLTSKLHAAEPYAAASLVTAVLRATCMLPGTLSSAHERRDEAFERLHGTAGHCLE
jgi:hypothetical protein